MKTLPHRFIKPIIRPYIISDVLLVGSLTISKAQTSGEAMRNPLFLKCNKQPSKSVISKTPEQRVFVVVVVVVQIVQVIIEHEHHQ